MVWFVEIFTNRWRRPLKIATLLPQNAAAVVLPTFNVRPSWEDYKMEKVDGAELGVEDEIVDGVPKYVHPNTHISG